MELESIPQNIEVKDSFVEHYKKLLGDSYDEFMKYSMSYVRKSIRVNTIKSNVNDIKKRLSKSWKLTQIPFCNEGFWIEYKGDEVQDKRFDIGNLKEHYLGYIYVQEAESMIPPVVLNPKPNELVLDLCASPGSKSSQIAMYMENSGLLVANDNKADRVAPLSINLQRCGVSNTLLTLGPGQRFKKLENAFDKVLCDVPCSGTGTIRKSLKTLKIWSPNIVRKLTNEQKRLLEAGFTALKPGGTLVYSTCTVEPSENESVVSWLIENYPNAKIELIKLNINSSKPILSFEKLDIRKECVDCLRVHPQDNNSMGFFVTKIKKVV